MIATSVPPTTRERAILEAAEIHEAACRYRRQGLVCSTCTTTRERADRVVRAVIRKVAA